MVDVKKSISCKAFVSGVFFLAVGILALVVSLGYETGTAGRMGPGYFPALLSTLLILLGAVSIVMAFVKPDEVVGKPAYGHLALITLSVVLFGVALRPLGLVVSTILFVMISSLGSPQFSWKRNLILAIGLAIGCTLVFVLLLGLPIPIAGTLLGGR